MHFNMKLEDQVCSLDLANRLKELGCIQKSTFYWAHYVGYLKNKDTWVLVRATDQWGEDVSEYFAAFTVAELGEMLPLFIVSGKTDRQPEFKKFLCFEGAREDRLFIPDKRFIADAETEADARAKMLIYLTSNTTNST